MVQGKEEETVERINRCLPSDIRVFKILRYRFLLSLTISCTKNFNAKNFCDRRQYEYLLPVYALAPFDASSPPQSVVEDVELHWAEYVENEEYLRRCLENPSVSSESPFDDRPHNRQRVKSLQRAQRLVAESSTFAEYAEDAQDVALGGCVGRSDWPEYLSVGLARLRACMSLFVGTHNFHNYTVGKTSVDASAQRHILRATVSDPIRIHDDLYLRICLEGQSFMLHQIRKMVGIAIEVARGRCTLHTVNSSLSRGNMLTPMAPSTGLFLSKVVRSSGVLCSRCSQSITRSRRTKPARSTLKTKAYVRCGVNSSERRYTSILTTRSKQSMSSLPGYLRTTVLRRSTR